MKHSYLIFFLLITSFCTHKKTENIRLNLELIAAAHHELDSSFILSLLEEGADLNFQDSTGNSALHYSLSNYGHCKNVNMFLTRKNIDVNLRNKASQTPILLTLDNNYIIKLIALGADVNVQDYSGKTPLHYACSKNDPELVDLLLSKGANVNIKDSLGFTPLISCFKEVTWPSFNGPAIGACGTYYLTSNRPHRVASYKIIKALLEKGAKINESDNEGRSALNYAILQNNQPVLLLLLSLGAEVGKETSVREELLTNSIYGGNSEIVKWLLEEGCNPNQIDNDGKTILCRAAEVGTSRMVQYLMEAGANPSVPFYSCLKCKSDKQISFPIHAATNSGNIEALEDLLKKADLDVNVKDYKQRSPLHLAVEQDSYYNNYLNHRKHLLKYLECIELLLTNGADPNQVNLNGQTPLMLIKDNYGNWPSLHQTQLSTDNLIRITNLFANNCTDFNIRDKNGASVFMYISRCHNIKMTERMLSAGADINIKDNNGNTALDYALIYQNDLNEKAKNIKEGVVYIYLKKMEPQEDEIEAYINYLVKKGAKKGNDITNN
ncbi:MAG: ankyrin repeat domain-containing protein [Sporocytophaga sp.]|uniref:ankyrin repeat domain-containing protein n=1 Tax=Sporocytophaga sp. TaxID=2231183 RepID=UPI001B22D21B|nr:ankyrin repeat domain-containing protein [Sporocytophaga sp.]MBO9699052.1 ankyrin repeat domain-containing protein [Sporocytophaga sp.]